MDTLCVLLNYQGWCTCRFLVRHTCTAAAFKNYFMMAGRSSLVSLGKIINNTWAKNPNVRGMVAVGATKCTSKKNTFDAVEHTTHTGQAFDEDDFRRLRFVGKQKQVNEMFAIDLINEVPPEPKEARVVWCDGGGGPIGHPRVYINLDQPGNHTCGYCGLRFYKQDHHH